MKSSECLELYKELCIDNKIDCTQDLLDNFVEFGLLFKSGSKYFSRDNKQIDVNLIKSKTYNFNINLQDLIQNSIELSKTNKNNKVYCMTGNTFNRYKEQGLIITKKDVDYYRLFDNELWLVNLI